MRYFDVSRAADAPCTRVWEILTDTARWREWGPAVRDVVCSDRRIIAGSSGKVLTALGFWVPFRITDFEALRRWSWRVAGLPATGHRVEEGPGGGCVVVFEVPFAAAPYALICRIAAQRIVRTAEEQERRYRSAPRNGHDSQIAVH